MPSGFQVGRCSAEDCQEAEKTTCTERELGQHGQLREEEQLVWLEQRESRNAVRR